MSLKSNRAERSLFIIPTAIGINCFILIAVMLCGIKSVSAQDQLVFKGRVVNSQKQPLEFASVYYQERDLSVSTDANGNFSFTYYKQDKNISLKISYVGKKTLNKAIPIYQIVGVVVFELEDFSLNLEEIAVRPVQERSRNSNSSILYNREAIQEVQAFSLMDVLNTLPGKTSSAPNINSAQTITLRGGEQGGAYNLNNSLGVSIILDDIIQSNDANMQSRSSSRWGMGGSVLNGSFDVPYQGMDLREIPVESIEKIEVIQGVASAKYGELTDGAIIIDRQAGRSPYQFTTNINGGSTNYALTKGFQLKKNLGALNTGINLAKSNPDPRDRVQQYDRVSTTLMWTKNFTKDIKNTFTFDYNYRSDEVKVDPDDDSERMSYSKNKSVRLSTRLSSNLNSILAKKMRFNFSLNTGHQETYKQWLISQGIKTFANKDTTGIYEGIIIGGRYMAAEQIVGDPVTISSNLNFNTFLKQGSQWKHNIGYGASFNYSNNGGKGIVSDPDRPRWINTGGQNERPYSFESTPAMVNIGLYLEDNISGKILNKAFNANIGLRQDIQNGYSTLQPRVNLNYKLDRNFQVSLAYGIATKAPTLAHRYPTPTWIDIPLLTLLNDTELLYLVYTEKIIPDNSDLKPSKTTQFEGGIRYNNKFINASLFGYYKKSINGFDSRKIYRPIQLPEYAYEIVNGELSYFPTDKMITYTSVGDYQTFNLVSSDNSGLELMLSTRKIKAIETSFNLSTVYTHTSYFKDTEDLVNAQPGTTFYGDTVWYILFPPEKKHTSRLMTKIGTTTHIPKIGIVVSFNTDIYWQKNEKRINDDWRAPIAYINNKSFINYFTTAAEKEEGADILGLKSFSDATSKQQMIYGIVNMTVAKEIKKNIRISVAAYNAFSMHPEKYYKDPKTGEEMLFSYNMPTSITGGISIKF